MGREKSRQKTPRLQIQDFNSSSTQRALIPSVVCWVPGESSPENKRSYGFKSLRNVVLNSKTQGGVLCACYVPGTMLDLFKM